MSIEILRVSGEELRGSLDVVARLRYEIRPEWRISLSWQQVDSKGDDVRNELMLWTKELC